MELFFWGYETAKSMGPVVQVAAWLIEQDLLVMSETTTHKNPYLTTEGDPESKFPPIILGNTSGCHYQSYIPEKDIDFKELLKRDNGDNVNPFPVGFFYVC